MSFLNKYPYTDFHELNLDWFLEEFKKVMDKTADLETTVQQFTDFVTNYFDNLDVQEEINRKLDAMALDGTLGAILQPLVDAAASNIETEMNNRLADQDSEINVLVARMDTFASLPPGSTSGNAELLDIRVQADGDTAASAGDAVRAQIGEVTTEIEAVSEGVSENNVASNDHVYINVNTGLIDGTSATYVSTTRYAIPKGVTRIEFPDLLIASGGVNGWATYSSTSGSSTGTYVRGGQTLGFDVQPSDVAYAVSSVYYTGTAPATQKVRFIYGNVAETVRNANNELTGVVEDDISATNNTFVNANTGAISSVSATYVATSRVKIPEGVKLIIFPDFHPIYAGVAGWATYDTETGSAAGAYIRGGQTNFIEVQSGDRVFAVSTYYSGSAPSDIHVIYVYGDLYKLIIDKEFPLHKKVLAFVGDSVTWCLDDDTSNQLSNPWPKLVGEKLLAISMNEGVNSASLMDGEISPGVPTPCDWVNDYTNLDNTYDIVCTMIGINDAYRNYALGAFSDTAKTTFYGALHNYAKSMLAKYPPASGKRLAFIMYPAYDGAGNATIKDRWQLFRNAILEVMAYYAIPVLDLGTELGISCYGDTSFDYWRASGAGHSPHPTQDAADLMASVVASWLVCKFAK